MNDAAVEVRKLSQAAISPAKFAHFDPKGARRAVSESRMPCQDMAVALRTAPTSPMATAGHAAVNSPANATLPAIPRARPAITSRGLTWKLPTQPHRMRHGTATATTRENRNPAAASS